MKKRSKTGFWWLPVVIMVVLIHPAAGWTVLNHQLTVRLDPAGNRLQATDIITIPPEQNASVVLELAHHLTVERVTRNNRKVPFSFEHGRLQISLSNGSGSRRVRVAYGGRFTDAVPAEPLNLDNPGFGVAGIISNQGTMLLDGAKWYPAGRNAPGRYSLVVDAPEGVVAVTIGRPLGHTTRNGRTISRWAVDHPVRGLPLVAGPYVVTTRRFGKVSAATYFSAPLQHLSDTYLDATGRYLELYSELFGPYPYGQFAVVENFFPTGYGFPSFTLMGRRVLQLPFIIHTSLGHEIAHCWWGNGVMADPSQGNWSEGLTTYVADYLYKERRGQGLEYRRQWLRNYTSLVNDDNDFPVDRFISRIDPVTKVVGYDKAAMVFHMLRQRVGEDAFWQTLKEIYLRNRFKSIGWSHFQTAFEKHSEGSLDRFFSQWIGRSGAPQLALENVAVNRDNGRFVVRGTVVQQPPCYDFPLKLTLAAGKGELSQQLQVSGARTPFRFEVPKQPARLTADPEVALFRRLWPQEIPPTINTLKGSVSVRVVVADNLEASWLKIAGRLSAALGLKSARIGREGDFEWAALKRSDLLLVGRPSRRRIVPGEGYPFRLGTDAFELNGRTFSGTAASFFGVFEHPQNPERTAALFLTDDFAAAKAVSTKIPHYGKYSYLVFDQSRNQDKGTWAVKSSPMVVSWP